MRWLERWHPGGEGLVSGRRLPSRQRVVKPGLACFDRSLQSGRRAFGLTEFDKPRLAANTELSRMS